MGNRFPYMLNRAFAVQIANISAALAIALGGLLGGTAGAGADINTSLTNPKHFFYGIGTPSSAGAAANDLIYHGGNVGTENPIGVERTPSVYLVWWGPQWATGFTTPDTDANHTLHSSTELQTYLQSFFSDEGGTAWAGVQTQYCRNLPAGVTSCNGYASAQFVTNPAGQLKGVWTDPSPVPSDIVTLGLAENLVDDPIAAEARKAVKHFGYHANATYFVLTPDEVTGTGQPVYCGYHTQTTSVDDLGNPYRFQYAFIPFQNHDWGPPLGQKSCGMHFVNPTTDAFGHGIWDGYSIVDGHEYAEAVTDPDNYFSVQDGWNDAQGSENGDKCAWMPETQNVNMGTHYYAVQALWSNEAFDAGRDPCAVTR
ncbi:MAG TPA: hypothetical protein VF160_17620 [Candidatus Dormibacteraeota bacterium]